LVHVSEMSWTRKVRHPSKVVSVGDAVEAVVLNVDKGAKRISLGMKQVGENPWHIVKDKYPPGSIVEGKIRNLTDFGAFMALEEGIDGLIHISDMSWSQRIKHPSEVFKKGQRVQAMVLSVDAENERLSLGVKQLTPDPWSAVSGKYWVGDNVQVEVVKLTNFGAFAELEPGVEGLIHLSELGRDRVESPEEVLQVGDVVNAKIIKVDVESRKIGLSIRAYVEEFEERGEEPVVLVSRAPKIEDMVVAQEGPVAIGTAEVPVSSEDEAGQSFGRGPVPPEVADEVLPSPPEQEAGAEISQELRGPKDEERKDVATSPGSSPGEMAQWEESRNTSVENEEPSGG